MRGVSVIGIGSTTFGVLEGKPLKEIATMACLEAINDAGINKNDIDAFYLGNYISGILVNQETIAPLIANSLGLRKDIACTKVEGACCSAGIACRHGFLLISSGLCDIVLVAGVEKMTSASTEKNTAAIASGMDWEQEGKTGLTFPGFFALVAQRYMYEYGCKMDHISSVCVKNRANGVKNPRARFRKEVTLEDVLNGKQIVDPLRLHDCCPVSDGAAALVLCRSDWADKFTKKPIDILGAGMGLGTSTAYEMPNLVSIGATVEAAGQAYKMSGIKPGDVDVVELHDCFSIAEVVDCEDLGFFEKGRGAFAAFDGETRIGGKIPINPSGGLLSKGHPVGATGAGQVYEICKQLRGEHENQVKDAEIGLVHNLGGSGAVSTVHILRRR